MDITHPVSAPEVRALQALRDASCACAEAITSSRQRLSLSTWDLVDRAWGEAVEALTCSARIAYRVTGEVRGGLSVEDALQAVFTEEVRQSVLLMSARDLGDAAAAARRNGDPWRTALYGQAYELRRTQDEVRAVGG